MGPSFEFPGGYYGGEAELPRVAPCAWFVVDDSFGNTKEKRLGFPNVYKYNLVQTVKQAVQNHVTPVLPSLFGSSAFTTYSAFIRRLKLPARSSGPSAAGFPPPASWAGDTVVRTGWVPWLCLRCDLLVGALGLLQCCCQLAQQEPGLP